MELLLWPYPSSSVVKLGSSASSLTCPYKFRDAKFRGTRLIHLCESGEYKRINIHAIDEYAFRCSCANGHIEIAQWLIMLGESEEYERININAADEWAFRCSYANDHIQIARWLIQLGESGGYDKIDQEIINKYIKN